MNEAERIAAGLTHAKLAAFARSKDCDMHPNWAGHISTWGNQAVAEELHRLGLTEKPETMAKLTPLGLSVRRILSETPHAE